MAGREISTRVRTKAFRVLTVLVCVLVVGGAIVISAFDPGSDPTDVTIGLEAGAEQYRAALGAGNESINVTVIDLTTADPNSADPNSADPNSADPNSAASKLGAGDIDVAIDGARLLWKSNPDRALDDYVRSVVEAEALRERATGAGLDSDELARLLTPVDLATESLSGDQLTRDVRVGAAAAGAMLLFMMLQIWGAFLTMGVVEEKSSRVVEVLLAQIRPVDLLVGKVLGLGAIAFAQMALFLGALLVGFRILDVLALPSEVWRAIPLVAVVFVLGAAFYFTFFAAVGALVSRQEDVQVAQLPAGAPLLAAYIIGSASLANPENPALTIGSFVPFTSPVLLPFRVAATDVPWWQVALSLVLLAGGAVVMVRLAARVYSLTLLRTGTRVPWREAIRLGLKGSR